MLHTSYIELDQKALASNLRFIRSLVGKEVLISSVVKGNAYGHGIGTLVPAIEKAGSRHFSVFNAEEAEEVRKAISHPDSQIMIMGMIENEALPWAIEHGIQFFVFEMDRLQAAIAAAKELGKPARIHLEVETGMNRTGFNQEECKDVVAELDAHPGTFILEGICTHLAGAERIANYVRVTQQIHRYSEHVAFFEEHGYRPLRRHAACSAGVVRYPETHFDMVRVGIMMYGFWPSQETLIECLRDAASDGEDPSRYRDPLKRVISWKSSVMSVKDVKMGEFIGYGTSYMATKNMKIALIPVGYAYGFGRSLSNVGRVLINGKRVEVVGLVNMNLMMVNIKEIPHTKKGDEVVLIGKQGKRTVSVSAFGDLSNQLNYELLTRLPISIPRRLK